MSSPVVTVPPETSLKEVARLLGERGISGVPVCDVDGRVLGVVSEADIIRQEQGLAPEAGSVLRRLLERAGAAGEQLAPRTASEAMTAPAVVVSPITDVSRAARLMLEQGVNRLPVVERGEVVGIVTRADLVRAFHRSDEAIEAEIREDVLQRILWIDPSQLFVSVCEGDVVVTGSVENRSAAELVDAYVRGVPGVVSVLTSLTWAIDDLSRRTAHSL